MPLDRGARAELRALIARFHRPLVLGVTLTFADRVASFVMPMLSKVMVDRVAIQHRFGVLPLIAAAAALAAAVQAATTYYSQRTLGLMGQNAVAELRTNLLARLLTLPISFFDRTPLGALVSRVITDTGQVEGLLGSGLVPLIGATLSALIGMGLMISLNWRLAIAMFVVLAVSGIWGTRTLARLHASFTALGESTADATAKLTETLAGISIIKAFAAEPHHSAAFSALVQRQSEIGGRTIDGIAALNTGMVLITGATTLVLIAGGGYAVAHSRMTLGDLAAFVLCAGLVAAPILQLSAMSTVVGKAGAALSRIHQLMDLPGEEETNQRRVPVMDVAGAVTFQDVHFSYTPDKPALNGIDLAVSPGATVALVGPSGSGKSTLCRLLLAFDRPSSGRILIDGRDLATLRLRDYRARLGVVLQDTFLFDGTARDNIAFARPSATDDEVRAASRIAHCDEFLTRLPNAYATTVGERGVTLSGGQRQRIAIARAILADPRILILDEATSNLDAESEALVRDGLRALRAGRTTFVIAHHLSTIETADQILVLDAGRLVERGTHRELMALDGRYRRLHVGQRGSASQSDVVSHSV